MSQREREGGAWDTGGGGGERVKWWSIEHGRTKMESDRPVKRKQCSRAPAVLWGTQQLNINWTFEADANYLSLQNMRLHHNTQQSLFLKHLNCRDTDTAAKLEGSAPTSSFLHRVFSLLHYYTYSISQLFLPFPPSSLVFLPLLTCLCYCASLSLSHLLSFPIHFFLPLSPLHHLSSLSLPPCRLSHLLPLLSDAPVPPPVSHFPVRSKKVK